MFTSLFLSYFFSVIILLIYSLLQLSYTLVSHNFGLNLLGYGYVNITFFILISTCLNTLFFTLIVIKTRVISNPHITTVGLLRRYKKVYMLGFQPTLHPLNILVVILFTLTLYIYLTSFNPIINNIF
jgi:hypothetical protein